MELVNGFIVALFGYGHFWEHMNNCEPVLLWLVQYNVSLTQHLTKYLCQAYEKEDETPAAVPAEKKEKAAEKVKCPSE